MKKLNTVAVASRIRELASAEGVTVLFREEELERDAVSKRLRITISDEWARWAEDEAMHRGQSVSELMEDALSAFEGNNILDESSGSGGDGSSSDSGDDEPAPFISDYDYEDLVNLRFPTTEEPHAVLSVYADESKSGEKIPVIAVGGGLGTGKEWGNLLRGWREAMKTEPSVEVFHTSEFETPPGRINTVYEDWGDDRLIAFQSAMLAAKRANVLSMAPAAAVCVEEFNSVIPAEIQKRIGDAYYFCAFMLIHQIAVYAGRYFPNERVTYHFECGGPHQQQLAQAYDAIKEDERVKKYYRFWLKPDFLSKDAHPGLQIADKLVFEAAKHVSHELENERAGKKIWRTRYPTEDLVLSGWDIHIRLYEAPEIKEVYKRWGVSF